jgi:hypothetical protein
MTEPPSVITNLPTARYSQTLPRDFIFRARYELVPTTPSSDVHNFLARQGGKMENTCMENHFHPVLHLNSSVRIYVPRLPPHRPPRPVYSSPSSPRSPRRTVSKPNDGQPWTVTYPTRIHLHMNEPPPDPITRPPIRGLSDSERQSRKESEGGMPVQEPRSPRGERRSPQSGAVKEIV